MKCFGAIQFSPIFIRLRQSRLLGTTLVCLAYFHLAIQLAIFTPRELMRTDSARDVVVYWKAGQNVNQGLPIYHDQPKDNVTVLGTYIYAPPFAAVMSLFSSLTFLDFARIWFGVTLLSFWIFAWCLAKISGRATLRRTLLWGLVTALFPGTYNAIGLGQVDPILWALFVFGLVNMERLTLWTIASTVKAFYFWPALVEIASVAKQKDAKVLLRAICPTILVLTTLVIYGGIVCGWHTYSTWAQQVLPSLSQGNFSAGNVSISFAVLRLARFLGWQYNSSAPLPMLAHLWLTIATIGAPLLTWYKFRFHSVQIKSAALMPVAVLFSPICWTSYLPLLLPLIALLFRSSAFSDRAEKTCLTHS